MKKAVIVGSGFGGLGAACLLGKSGWDVTVIEKNEQVGGRAGYFEAKGFKFDSGPSWYLMPDIFEQFFESVGENIPDHVTLTKLSPSYRVFYKGTSKNMDIYSDLEEDMRIFEALEPGAGKQLKKYLQKSEYIHQVAMGKFLYKNYSSLRDFFTPQMLNEGRKLNVLSNMHAEAGKYFKNPQLRQIMEYPSIFLGTSPYKTPAIYSLMNHVLFGQGVYYPQGGIYELTRSLENIARKNGAKTILNTPVNKIITRDKKAIGVSAGGQEYAADIVISNADIYHTETNLLGPKERDHSEAYWQSRILAPSALLVYLGIKGEYPSLSHHNLLFAQEWKQNFAEIFGGSQFPTDPSLYVCAPSKTDPTVAPSGHENLFVLIPIAAGIDYTQKQLDQFASKILETLETEMNLPDLRKNIVYKKLFCVKDFESRFNSFKGTGLGLAHTLRQSAAFRPRNTSRKIKNLYYVGANTHPGIGLPPALISAQLAHERITKSQTNN